MKNSSIGAILLSGLLVAPIQASMAQTTNVAYASEPRAGYVVFFDRGTDQLSSVAEGTIRNAAVAARSGGTLHLVGRADHAEAVKTKLVQDGVPATSIVVESRTTASLPDAGDGLSAPANRRVEIKY